MESRTDVEEEEGMCDGKSQDSGGGNEEDPLPPYFAPQDKTNTESKTCVDNGAKLQRLVEDMKQFTVKEKYDSHSSECTHTHTSWPIGEEPCAAHR